jgi:hypothetical protein
MKHQRRRESEHLGTVRVMRDSGALRETILGLRGDTLLLMGGMLVAAFVIAGYVTMTVLLFLPLLGMRMMFPRWVHQDPLTRLGLRRRRTGSIAEVRV